MSVLYVCVSGAVNNDYQNKITLKKTKLKLKKIQPRVGSIGKKETRELISELEG